MRTISFTPVRFASLPRARRAIWPGDRRHSYRTSLTGSSRNIINLKHHLKLRSFETLQAKSYSWVLKRVRDTRKPSASYLAAICALPDDVKRLKLKPLRNSQHRSRRLRPSPQTPSTRRRGRFPCQAININAIAAARDDLVEIRTFNANKKSSD